MVAGFVVDNIFFHRIDLVETQIVFTIYALVCAASIALLHFFEARARRPRWRFLLPLATQFALGGFWSGFVIFYGRAADFSVSWPFLLVLVLIFLGNEYFRGVHERLVYASILFFFALYSYLIFLVPIYTHSIGTTTFLVSGALATALFALFTVLLRFLGRERFMQDVWRIRLGALAVLAVINLSYFTNILPPLPLSLSAAGIYHEVERVPDAYLAVRETEQSWPVRYLGFPPTLHLKKGELAYAYAEIFAPTDLNTTVVHTWQWHDPVAGEWVQKSRTQYPIRGGRAEGYRGYSATFMNAPGKWRVQVETADGLVIARLPFYVEFTEAPVYLEQVRL